MHLSKLYIFKIQENYTVFVV